MDPKFEAKVAEIRNSVARKLNKWDRPIFGYRGDPEPERKEGDVWLDDNGKQWTIKNGLRQSISKMAAFRTPLFCPECTLCMNHRYDTKFYRLYNKCYNCTIEWQTKMRISGTWEAFERKTLRDNERGYLKDKIQEHKDYLRNFKLPQVHFEDGRFEILAQLSQFEQLFADIKQDIKFCEDRIKFLDEEERCELTSSTEETTNV